MFDQCRAEYQDLLRRIETVVNANWPETLRSDSGVWQWLDDHSPELRKKQRDLTQRLNAAWQNGIVTEVKKLSTEWGRVQLDIFRGYALYLKREAAQ